MKPRGLYSADRHECFRSVAGGEVHLNNVALLLASPSLTPSVGMPCPVAVSVQLMSSAAQHYLKELLNDLKVIAWQRKGGLSTDLLVGE